MVRRARLVCLSLSVLLAAVFVAPQLTDSSVQYQSLGLPSMMVLDRQIDTEYQARLAQFYQGIEEEKLRQYLIELKAQEDAKAAAARRVAVSRKSMARAAGSAYISSPATTEDSVNGYPCGPRHGLPPCRVLRRESGGNPTAVNPDGCYVRGRAKNGCYGMWQYDVDTWNNYGGYDEANLAPASVQNEKTRALWAGGKGCSHWGVCGRRM